MMGRGQNTKFKQHTRWHLGIYTAEAFDVELCRIIILVWPAGQSAIIVSERGFLNIDEAGISQQVSSLVAMSISMPNVLV